MLALRAEPNVVVWPSWMTTFAACPRRYRNQHLLGLPGEDDGTPQTRRGQAAHAELCARHSSPERHDDALPATPGGDTFERLTTRHRAVCPWRVTPGARYLGGERTLGWALPRHRVLLLGKVDAVWELPDGTIEVRDYKTGPSPPDPHDHAAALVYGLLATATWPDRDVRVTYECLEANIAVRTVELDSDRRSQAIARVLGHVAEVIDASEWPARPGPACERCPYRLVCPQSAHP